jgi:hypothetical protein
MGSAALAYELFANQMHYNPKNPAWINRDRFVLSAGHASMLLYALLYLFDYGLTLDDLKQFRQWDSKTPGHPEFGHTAGVEATRARSARAFRWLSAWPWPKHIWPRASTSPVTTCSTITSMFCPVTAA